LQKNSKKRQVAWAHRRGGHSVSVAIVSFAQIAFYQSERQVARALR